MSNTQMKSFQLRIPPETCDKVQQLAGKAGISMNRLISALLDWAIEYGHAGEPVQATPDDDISTNPIDSVVWFGGETQMAPVEDEHGDVIDQMPVPGKIDLILDFRDRHIVPK